MPAVIAILGNSFIFMLWLYLIAVSGDERAEVEQASFWIITVIAIIFYIVFNSQLEKMNFYQKWKNEGLKETQGKKEQKAIKKERHIQKKCNWCNASFRWVDSDCRYHCCRRCEAQDD